MASEADADAFVHAVVRDWRGAKLASADRALCHFATKLTREPHAISLADLDELRAQSLDDRAIHDATQVVGYFNYVTRVADALGVEPETFIRRWGDPPHSHEARNSPGSNG